MSDIRFNCPSCKQSLDAPSDMVGELIDCPSCKNTIEVPVARSMTMGESKPPHIYDPPAPRPLPILLVVSVFIAVVVSALYTYMVREDQNRDKAEAPYYSVAMEVFSEARQMQVMVNHNAAYHEYKSNLYELSMMVDRLANARVAVKWAPSMLYEMIQSVTDRPSSSFADYADTYGKGFKELLERYKCALEHWEYQQQDQEDWLVASKIFLNLDNCEYSRITGKSSGKIAQRIWTPEHGNQKSSPRTLTSTSTGKLGDLESLIQKGDYFGAGFAVQKIGRASGVIGDLKALLSIAIKKEQGLQVLRERSIFGINLGESISEVRSRADSAGLISTSQTEPYSRVCILGSLDGNKAVEKLEPRTDDGTDRVYRVTVTLSDKSYETFLALDKELNQKYGRIKLSKYEESPDQFVPNQNGSYSTVLNGQNVRIQLSYWSPTSDRVEGAKGVFIEYVYSAAEYLPWLQKTLKAKIDEGIQLQLIEAQKGEMAGSLRDAL